ncbi:hypothetical protein L1887_15026 [Cichorium endivia]|nr:hypothetical protein L1887_15026 [Cichorium endivia]
MMQFLPKDHKPFLITILSIDEKKHLWLTRNNNLQRYLKLKIYSRFASLLLHKQAKASRLAIKKQSITGQESGVTESEDLEILCITPDSQKGVDSKSVNKIGDKNKVR